MTSSTLSAKTPEPREQMILLFGLQCFHWVFRFLAVIADTPDDRVLSYVSYHPAARGTSVSALSSTLCE